VNQPDNHVNPLDQIQLAFIGCGVMAEAIIAGLLRKGLVAPANIVGSHPREVRRNELSAKYGIRVTESNREAAAGNSSTDAISREGSSDSIVVLAVKPQRLGGVLGELKNALRPEQLVL
jgi:pyrroline-5-carboxylate reductase